MLLRIGDGHYEKNMYRLFMELRQISESVMLERGCAAQQTIKHRCAYRQKAGEVLIEQAHVLNGVRFERNWAPQEVQQKLHSVFSGILEEGTSREHVPIIHGTQLGCFHVRSLSGSFWRAAVLLMLSKPSCTDAPI